MGGYKIIDLKGANLETGGASAVIPGIYAKVANKYGKATLVTGLVIDDAKVVDMFVPFELDDTDYKAVIHGTTTLVVSLGDEVSITE